MNTANSAGMHMLEEARVDLTHADNKAGLLLASYGIAVAALLAGFITGGFVPTGLAALPQALWWLGSAVLLVGVVLAGAAVYPRISRKRSTDALYFWGDVAHLASPEETKQALALVSDEFVAARIADQLWFVSQSVTTKYRLIQFSIVAGGGAATLFILCGLANL